MVLQGRADLIAEAVHGCLAQAKGRLKRLDLRFHNDEEEAAFLGSRDSYSLACMACIAAIVVLAYPLQIWSFLLPEVHRESQPFEFEWADPRMIFFLDLTQHAAGGLGTLGYALLRLRYGVLRAWSMERLWMVATVYSLLSYGMSRTFHTCGYVNPNLKYDGMAVHMKVGNETFVVAEMQFVAMLLCLMAPVRVHTMIFPVLFAPAFYIYVNLLFGAENNGSWPPVFVMNVVINLLALHCAWRNERDRRLLWMRARPNMHQQAEVESGAAIVGEQLDYVRALAEHVCDFVVDVGADLRVIEVHRSEWARLEMPPVGQLLTRVVVEHDHERLASFLDQAFPTELPHRINVTMLSPNGRVEASVVTVAVTSEPRRLLLGVHLLAAEVRAAGEMRPGTTAVGLPMRHSSSSDSAAASSVAFNSLSLDQIKILGCSERWWLDAADLQLNSPPRVLGSGAYGVVLMARYHGKAVAVKTPRHSQDSVRLRELANELRVLRHVRHPNIVLFHGALVNPEMGELALVYELVRGMTLHEYIREPGSLPDAVSRFSLCFDMCCALRYLHAQRPKIVHGDLKDRNVMVEVVATRPRAKLIDFGLARFLTPKAQRLGGTLGWRAPESLRGAVANPSADVFSFGWLMHFVTTGLTPYNGAEGEDLRLAVADMQARQNVGTLAVPRGVPYWESSHGLCERCLTYDAALRPDMLTVYSAMTTWLEEGEACLLGFEVASVALPVQKWHRAVGGDESGGEDGAGGPESTSLPEVQVDIQVSTSMEILVVMPELFAQHWPCDSGASFCHWFEDPSPLRVWIRALIHDIQQGVTTSPIVLDYGRALLKEAPGLDAAQLTAAVKVFVPDSSGRASVRLFCWRKAMAAGRAFDRESAGN